MKYLIGLVMLLSSTAFAHDLAEVSDLYIDYTKFAYNNTPFMPPGSKAEQQINLGLNLTFLDNLYFNSMIHSQQDQSQFRLVGWNWRLGVQLTQWLDIGWNHFSRHTLDVPGGPWMEDGVFIRFNLIKGHGPEPIW